MKDSKQPEPVQSTHTYSCSLSIAEAARATVSNPKYFGSHRTPNGTEYLGGSVDFCNPAPLTLLEAKFLWPPSLESHPDIMLSIGSGYSCQDLPACDSQSTTPKLSGCEDAEAVWDKAFRVLSKENPGRYIRVSPQFTPSIPDVDDVEALNSGKLQEITTEFLNPSESRAGTDQGASHKIDLIIRRLISTTFYFHHTSLTSQKTGDSFISGTRLLTASPGWA